MPATPARPSRPAQRPVLLLSPLVVALVLGACSTAAPAPTTGTPGAPTSSPPSISATSATSAVTTTGTASAAACVPDPAKVVAAPAGAASAAAVLPAADVATLDAAAQASFRQAAAPGAIVGVRTPQGTWTNAYGLADPTTKSPMAVDMNMRIGSVTKTFTGTLVMQLAQEGKLTLDGPIARYVPGIPNGGKVTLRVLADMTSGVSSYYTEDFLATYFAHPDTVFTPDRLIAYGVAASPVFEPGAKFNYSNTNTILLGKVVEKVTGQPFEKELQERILAPLGLTHTTWPGDSPTLPTPHPRGYTLQGDANPSSPVDATNWNPSFGWAAGGMVSTVADQLMYARALGTGQRLLSPAVQTQRLTSFPQPAGYGLAIACVGGWVGHTGELPGFNTMVFYDTTSDTSVVVLVNSDIPSGDCTVSATLTDNSTDQPCSSPAMRILVGISTALGHPFVPLPTK